jgi:hypothetical protein
MSFHKWVRRPKLHLPSSQGHGDRVSNLVRVAIREGRHPRPGGWRCFGCCEECYGTVCGRCGMSVERSQSLKLDPDGASAIEEG